jgi:spore germination cell wall hydrolase CwlJ-like protein
MLIGVIVIVFLSTKFYYYNVNKKQEIIIPVVSQETQLNNRNETREVEVSRGGPTERSIKTVQSSPIEYEITEEELNIFERIVEAEVGGDNYNGKLAVANVILNRVKSPKFPNTIKEVVFAPGQFSPISDKRFYSVKVNETTKKVVQDALSGKKVVPDTALYFCTPTAPGRGWFNRALNKVSYIAPHNFYSYR